MPKSRYQVLIKDIKPRLIGSKDNDPSEWKRIEAEGRDLLAGYCDILRKAGI
jgi:hypothetical protein